MNENQIIQGCKAKRRDAQMHFVNTYSNMLFAVCKRYAKDYHTSQDYLQESLVHILNNIEKYQSNDNFKGWIHTVTVRKCLVLLRKEKRNMFNELEENYDAIQNENVHYQLEKEEVLKFMEELPDNYRIVINMYLIEGYSHKEIADHLGISESSSRTFLTRARRRIQEAFEDNEVSLFRAS